MLRDIAIIIFIIFICFISGVASASVWECINRPMLSCNTWVMSVPGGYVIEGDNINDEHTLAMTYVPDPQHSWNPEKR